MSAASGARPFETVAILGLGVMGGSLARALAQLPERPSILGWSPSREERNAATAAGVVDEAPLDWRDAVKRAQLTVLAAPLKASCDLFGEIAASAPASATLSDVASLKAPLERAAHAAGAKARWVGCHPMAGSEASGFAASSAALYRGARVWIVASDAARDRVPAVQALWRSVGARPEAIDALEHDRLMAVASHLPQLASNALATVMMEAGIRPEQLGPGGRDTTRLAASSPDLWKDLLQHASPELTRSLRELAGTSARMADMLDAGDIEGLAAMMQSTRAWRQP